MNKIGWIVLGAIITVVAIVGGAAALFLASARGPDQTEFQTHTEARVPARVIFVDFENSDVRVMTAVGLSGRVDIERTLRWDRAKPTVTEVWSGDTLRISHDCPDNELISDCSVDYLLLLPDGATTEVDIETSSGDISVTGTTGRITVSAVSGEVQVTSDSPSIEARNVSGDVTVVAGAQGAATSVPQGLLIETVSGDIRATFTAPPKSLDAKAVSGDVIVELPTLAGGYRIDTGSASGDETVRAQSSATSAHTVTVETVSGDIRVQ
jgi:hypothetical protein